MSLDDLCAQVLAHLHANSAMRLDDVAAAIGAPREDVEAAVDRLVREGHLERQGDRLVPPAAPPPPPRISLAGPRPLAPPPGHLRRERAPRRPAARGRLRRVARSPPSSSARRSTSSAKPPRT